MATLRTFQWWAVAVGIGVSCSVSPAGLSPDASFDEGSSSSGGAPSSPGSGGASGGTGGQVVPASGGTSGLASGGSTQSGGATDSSGGAVGSGGVDSGGAFGAGGIFGYGGRQASGGVPGTGGAGSGGTPSSGGSAGSSTGGRASGGAPGSGGATSGGAPGSGGSAGTATGGRASGGAPGSGGRAGSGGRMGTTCSRYPEGAMPFVPPGAAGEHCYWFRAEARTWQAARTQCMSETGGDLVTIRSAEENQFVRALARFTNSPPEIWIGATDDRAGNVTTGPGTYHWVVAGEPWGPYTNWSQLSPKQPDGYCDPCDNGQPCTCDHRGTMAADGSWYDFWQENPRGYVCEAVPAAN